MKKPSLAPTLASSLSFTVVLAAGSIAAPQGGPFHCSDLPWDLQIVPPGALAPGQQFEATEAGHFNPDDLPDVVVLAGNEARVVVNPGQWGAVARLAGGVSDVAVVRGTDGGCDQVLTVGLDGLVAWSWHEAREPGEFVPEPVGVTLCAPSRLEVQSVGDGSGGTLAVVWDTDANGVHELRLLLLDAGDVVDPHPGVTPLPSIPLAEAPMDFAIVDLDRDGGLEVAITDSTGLRVVDLLGEPLDSYPGNLQSGLLRPIEPSAVTGLPTRLVWIRQGVSQSFQRLRVVDSAGIEQATLLTDHPVRAVGSGVLNAPVGDWGDHDLVLGVDEIGSAWILTNGCVAEAHGGAPARTFDTSWEECSFFVDSSTEAYWSLAEPVLADFDLDGYGDLLVFDDEQGTGCVMRRVPAVPSPSAILPLWIQFPAGGSAAPSATPTLSLIVSADVLDARTATHFEVVVWPWTDYLAYELCPDVVGYGLQPRDPSAPQIEFTLEVDVDEADMPDLLAIEMRALRDTGGAFRTVDVATFVLTDDCEIFCQLDAATGGGGIEAPEGCLCPGGQDPPIGINLGGLVEVPRLPPFADGAIPIIPTGDP